MRFDFNVSKRTKMLLVAGSILLLSTIIAGVILLTSKQNSTKIDEDNNPIVEVPMSYAAPIIGEDDDVPLEETPEDIDYRTQHEALIVQYENKQYDALVGGFFFYHAAFIKVLAEPSTYSITQTTQNSIELNIYGSVVRVSIPYESFGSPFVTASKLDTNRFVEFANLYRTTSEFQPGYKYVSYVSNTKECALFDSSYPAPCASNTLAFLSETTSLQDYILDISCQGNAESCDKAVTSLYIEPQFNTESRASTGLAYFFNSKVIAKPGTFVVRDLNTYPTSFPNSGAQVVQFEFYDLQTLINLYEVTGATNVYGGLGQPNKVASPIVSRTFENLSGFAVGADSTVENYYFVSNSKNTACSAGSGVQIPAPCSEIDGAKITGMSSSNNPTYVKLTCRGTFENCVESLERIILFVAAKNP